MAKRPAQSTHSARKSKPKSKGSSMPGNTANHPHVHHTYQKSHDRAIAWLALAVTLVLNTLTVGYTYGVISTRVSVAETQLNEVRSSIRDVSVISRDVEVVKTKLDALTSSVQRLERAIFDYRRDPPARSPG